MGKEKKIVLFIVEGSSDKQALEKIFQKIYRYSKTIEFRCTDGDISSDDEITKDSVKSRLCEIIDSYIKDQKLLKSDIFQVVQIFDTDGAYIPDTAILAGDSEHFVYTLEGISCKYIDKVKKRNQHKSEIMDYLLTIHDVDGLPYEMYYMACNLDHALYDVLNLSIEDKMDYADEFYERFKGKEELFIEFLNKDVVNGVPNSMQESWKYIKEGLHSIERHTNLHVYFINHPRPDGLY